jgi:hypothetical protein
MGPITLFDKSFLQSLTVDEAVWFDHYFSTNICPLFFVETLADLAKTRIREGRTVEDEVAIIAEKTPEISCYPCLHHADLCTGELMGNRVPMNGQIPLAGGRPVRSDGKTGVVFETSPEAEAFHRWQNRQFAEVERKSAHRWREMLSTMDLKSVSDAMRTIGITGKTCRSLAQAANIAKTIVRSGDKPFDQMKLVFAFLHIPKGFMRPILEGWQAYGYRPLPQHAPFVAHVLTVEIFFQVALAANLISADRPSNRVDIGYLFYLPFCNVFTSSDRLHEKCAPLFLREDQDFVWGADLKATLAKTNAHFLSTTSALECEAGLSSFPHVPVDSPSSVIVRLWDKHSPGWRDRIQATTEPMDAQAKRNLMETFKAFQIAPATTLTAEERNSGEYDQVALQRQIHRKRGSWWQVPKLLQSDDPD